jgi:flagellar hook-associated protein 3 FlgL
MRVTNSMMINTVLRDLNNNLSKMTKSQEQLSSGRRINRPSDDPVGIVSALRLRTSLTELDQYKSNAEDASSWLDTTDSSLNESGAVLQRVRELAVSAANDYLTQTERDAIYKEVDQLKQHLVQVGNTTFAGKYIFSGTKTSTTPFDNGGGYNGDNVIFNYEIAIGVNIPINVDGQTAFSGAFGAIDQFLVDLTNADTMSISTDIGLLDLAINNQLEIRADIGAKVNRLELAINRMDAETVNLTGLLSKTEDVDAAALITRLKMQESVYNASLSAGAKIVQPTLIDFLR